LPHVILTSELDWDPGQLDVAQKDDEQWFDAISDLEIDPLTNLFDEFGNYCHHVLVQSTSFQSSIDDILNGCVYGAQNHAMASETPVLHATPTLITPREQDYKALWPLFGWLSTDIIKCTFEVTTQYAHIPTSTILKKLFKSPNPALNVHQCNESVATDTVYSDTPAIDSGVTVTQFFVGCNSMICDIYGIKTDKQFVNTLEDNICDHGAPNKLISDRAQVEISKKVQDILCTLFIGSWQSEPIKNSAF